MKFHLAYNSDSHYLLPTFVSAASALSHASDRVRIIIDVLDCGISDEEWDEWFGRLRFLFPDIGGIVRHCVDMRRIRGFREWNGSVATYARILTPEILGDCDMCLFVDGDTLFTADPLELYHAYDDRHWIQGSVDDPCSEERRRLYAGYGLTVPDDYVCCGLMLMNLRALRANGFVGKCLDFLARYKVLTSVDQEAINCVSHGHIAKLSPEWGPFNYWPDLDARRIKCLHYVGDKPWKTWRPFSRHNRILITSARRLWLLFAGRVLRRRPWEMIGCSAGDYFKACSLTWISVLVMRVLNVIPLRVLRHRYEGSLRKEWSRREIRALLPRGIK